MNIIIVHIPVTMNCEFVIVIPIPNMVVEFGCQTAMYIICVVIKHTLTIKSA